jgi:glyoxylase-like metal-dependent hydrolase (beta-lactamase superfamily II)
VNNYIKGHGWTDKELMIFNSHSDCDHIWGNCAFENHIIIGHTTGRKRMLEKAQYELDAMPVEFRKGNVEIKFPDLTFDSRLVFEDDEIEFIYAPGHTICSSICYDKKESVLFTGDLVEYPMPYTIYEDLEVFSKSLGLIKNINAKTVVTAHSGIADDKLIDSNISYIQSLLSGTSISFEDKRIQTMHENNIKRVLILKYEGIIKQKLGEKFDYKTYKLDFWRFMKKPEDTLMKENLNMKSTSYEDLEKGLIDYIAAI